MAETITPKVICEAAGISPSYASMIYGNHRTPPRALAIHIFRRTGWRHESIASLSDDQMQTLESVDPWIAPKDRSPRRAA